MKNIWVDVETTGVNSWKNNIIELAVLYEDEKTKDVFHMYCNPESFPDDFHKIEEITGITRQFLADNGVSEKVLYEEFKRFLEKHIDPYNKQDKAVFLAYNAKFDNDFLRQLFKKNGDNYFGSFFHAGCVDILSTVLMCIRLGIIPDSLPDKKNETLCNYLGIDLKNAHSAISDIKASRLVQLELEFRLSGKKHLTEPNQIKCCENCRYEYNSVCPNGCLPNTLVSFDAR
jgi:DNA polymerase-3 subunit epsilon